MMKGGAMATSLVSLVVGFLFLSLSSSLAMAASAGPVEWGFKLDAHSYDQPCPHAQHIVASIVGKAHYKDPRMAAFHDCFVKVSCEASPLLGSVSSNRNKNKDYGTGFEVSVDEIKAALVAACCPGTASCADIVAFAARDSTAAGMPPAAQPPILHEPRHHTTNKVSKRPLSKMLIALIAALSTIFGAGTIGYGIRCCYNNHITIIRSEKDQAHHDQEAAGAAGNLEMIEKK